MDCTIETRMRPESFERAADADLYARAQALLLRVRVWIVARDSRWHVVYRAPALFERAVLILPPGGAL